MAKKGEISGNEFDYAVLRRLFTFIKPYRLYFFLLIFITLCTAVLAPIIPYLISQTINLYVKTKDADGMLHNVFLMIIVLAAQTVFNFSNTYLSGWLGQHVVRDIRTDLYNHLIRLRLKFFDNTPIGRLVTRNISDVETLAEVFSEGLAAMVAEVLQLIVILSFMFWFNWRLTLISLCMLPLLIISTYIFKEKIKVSFDHVRNAVAKLNTFVQEHITGMSIVQIFNTEQREYEKFKAINHDHRKANLKSVKYYSIYFPIADVIGAMGIGLVVWYGAHGLIDGFVEAEGDLVAFIMYINMFFRPIRLIADRFNTLQMGLVSTARIIHLLDNKEFISDEGAEIAEEIEGRVRFENVWFAYNDEEYVLKNVSFSVVPGQTIALVGATGAGKTSVINLLNRYYEINKGNIMVDDKSIKSYQLSSLRKHIGVVLQDVFLFSDTIRYNITLGDNTISDEKIWEAAKLIGAKRFIERLPGQLDYNVQERGVTLSMGQRQLISFVRAMVFDPKVLVLDEATSSVDTETELLIQKAIDKMMEGRTSIVIAHRLSTIQKADNIIVLDKGEVKESGTHDELLAMGGYYAHLHEMQFITDTSK